jgi:dTDP-4-dehydrorhamnose 3,5-epimerase
MKIIDQPLSGIFVIEPAVFSDDRGYFFESFNQEKFNSLIGRSVNFVQDNQSLSSKNVVRGLHYQLPPFAQGKLVRVARGSVLDVAVDIRKGSPTFGQHFTLELNDRNHLMMFIPEGFAHGFSALEDHTTFLYKCTNYYHKASERAILYNDQSLNINWQVSNAIVSGKDLEAPLMQDAEIAFVYG